VITLEAARQISLDRIAALEPSFRSRVRRWLDAMYASGNPVLVTEGFRSIARQRELWEKGVRPCAEPGKSYHNYGVAIDFCPLRPADKAAGMWEAVWEPESAYHPAQIEAAKYRMVSISTETGHLQDGRYANWMEAKMALENPLA
jgi:hypothetical protein